MAADLPISWSHGADTPHNTDQRKHFPSSQVAAKVLRKTVIEHMAHLDFVASDNKEAGYQKQSLRSEQSVESKRTRE